MPLMSVNLRDSGGIASHMRHLTKAAGLALRNSTHSDLKLICSDGTVSAHQCLLEPLSPLLSTVFQQHNCCNCSGNYCGRRETITIALPDVEKSTIKALLNIIYNGSATMPSKEDGKLLESAMTLLGVALPGKLQIEVVERGIKKESSAKSGQGEKKRPSSPLATPSPASPKRVKSEVACGAGGGSSKSSTHPQYLLLQLTQALMPFEEGKEIDCNVAGCKHRVKPSSLTSHFQKHFKEYSRQISPVAAITELSCDQCTRKFRYTKALNHHVKKAHSGQKKDEHPAAKDQNNKEQVGEKLKCDLCQRRVGSEWHLAPSRHNCPGVKANKSVRRSPEEKAQISCDQCGEKLISAWFIPPGRHSCSAVTKVAAPAAAGTVGQTEEADWNTECQLCAQIFPSQWQLKMHLTKQHYWDQMAEEFESWGEECSICLISFPTNRDLVFHMGDLHEAMNKYMEKDCFTPVNIGNVTLEERDKTCGMADCNERVVNFSNLKSHLTSHFRKAMRREFHSLTSSKTTVCPICQETLSNPSNTYYHLSKVHNVNLKFAAFHFLNPGSYLRSIFNIEALKKGVSFAPPSETPLYERPISDNSGKEILEKMQLKIEADVPPPQTLHSDDSDPEEGEEEDTSFRCVVKFCPTEKVFSTRFGLKKHIVLVHFRERLQKSYPAITCGNCDHQVSTNKQLLKHVASKHESALTWVMGKEGLYLPWRKPKIVPTQNLSSGGAGGDVTKIRGVHSVFNWPDCQLCAKSFKASSAALKMHYIAVHYSSRLEDLWGLKPSSNFCKICQEVVRLEDNLHLHIALKHQSLILGFMDEDGLWTQNYSSPTFSETESTYRVKAVRVEMRKNENSAREKTHRNEKPTLPLKQLMVCFLCNKDFNGEGQAALLAHYSSQEYRLELERNFIERPGALWTKDHRCPECCLQIPQRQDYILHIGGHHRAVEQFLPAKYRLPPASDIPSRETSFNCPLPSCSATKETQKALLVHLLVVHYRPDMESRYGPTFRTQPGRCPICSAALLQDFVCYMKHLAVEHKVVMAFVERDLEAPTLREKEEKREAERVREKEEKRKIEGDNDQRKEQESVVTNGITTVKDIRGVLDSDSDSD